MEITIDFSFLLPIIEFFTTGVVGKFFLCAGLILLLIIGMVIWYKIIKFIMIHFIFRKVKKDNKDPFDEPSFITMLILITLFTFAPLAIKFFIIPVITMPV